MRIMGVANVDRAELARRVDTRADDSPPSASS